MTTFNNETMLEPGREQLATFIDALFRCAGEVGFSSFHSFPHKGNKAFRISSAKLSGGLKNLGTDKPFISKLSCSKLSCGFNCLIGFVRGRK